VESARIAAGQPYASVQDLWQRARPSLPVADRLIQIGALYSLRGDLTRPVGELTGVGPATADLLHRHGLRTVGALADVPLLTVLRLLGARTGRTLHERAHGSDVRAVDPVPVAQSTSVEHRFVRDELDPVQHRRALAGQLGARLRSTGQAAGGLAIAVSYADQSTTTRSSALGEASLHTAVLGKAAYGLLAAHGLQRARVRAFSLRATALRPAALVSRQLSLDAQDDNQLLIESVADRARVRFGHEVLFPAVLAPTPATDRAA
jgi:DNA polymerase-4